MAQTPIVGSVYGRFQKTAVSGCQRLQIARMIDNVSNVVHGLQQTAVLLCKNSALTQLDLYKIGNICVFVTNQWGGILFFLIFGCC